LAVHLGLDEKIGIREIQKINTYCLPVPGAPFEEVIRLNIYQTKFFSLDFHLSCKTAPHCQTCRLLYLTLFFLEGRLIPDFLYMLHPT